MTTKRQADLEPHTSDSSSCRHDQAKASTVSEIHELNRRHWEATAPEWKRLRDEDGGWRRCAHEPQLAFDGKALETVQQFIGELRGKKVCIVASGDNYIAFALAGLGAEVTSVDICAQQLEDASSRAAELGLQIRFLQADAADLHVLEDSNFDLVCSSNGFFVWVADLQLVYSEIARILKPGGVYIFYDVHPFQRPWKDQVQPLEMVKSYWSRDSLESDCNKIFVTFHWTLADILNALIESGLTIRKVIESAAADSRFWLGPSYGTGEDDTLLDWKYNPRTGLPVWLTVAAMKTAITLPHKFMQ